MDLLFHALLPYMIGSISRLDKKLVAAFVLGGIAPDLDFLITWVDYLHPSSLLFVHRGITHTFFFGLFTALIVLYLASRESVKTPIQRFVDYDIDFSLIALLATYVGVLSHLFLDYLTTRGAPLFYPWELVRYSADIFFHTEIVVMIASLLIVVELFRERSRKNFNNKIFVIFIAFLLLVGAIRIEGKETTQSAINSYSSKSYPDANLFQWAILGESKDYFQVYEYNSLARETKYSFTFPRLLVKSKGDGLERAIDAAEKLPQIKLFRWRAYAVAVNASFRNESWHLEYYDPIVKADIMSARPAFQMTPRSYASILVRVEGDNAKVVR